MINKKDIIAINQRFDKGNFDNESSLDYALSHLKHQISWTKQLAYIIRAILIDHVFEEGNKRTACAVLIAHVDLNSCKINEKKALDIIKRVVLKNITSISNIQEMIEDAIQKK
jgi:prophage maintenance system killer protein